MMNNLKRFNEVRVIAQTVKNKGFQREYKNIITPILHMYQNRIASDDEMYNEINEAIVKIKQIAKSYQYTGNKQTANFEDHELLMTIEMMEI